MFAEAPHIPRAHPAHGHCHTPACWHRVSRARHRAFWHHALLRLSWVDRAWARCIASWETRGISWPRKASVNTGNGYGGGLQFSLPTALAAGFRPKPSRNHPTLATVTTTTLDEQMVRAVRWRNKAGASQWSTSRYC